MPTHWGLSGEPDQFSAPFPGIFVLSAIMMLFALLLPLLPPIDPRKQNYALFGNTNQLIQSGILLFLLGLHLVTIVAALRLAINMNRIIVPLVGLLFAGLGNVMGKIRLNWFVGFRTPWALNSADVWTRTHRFGARLMVILGLATMAAGLLFPAVVRIAVLAVGCCMLAELTFGYSFSVWRQPGESRG